MHASTYEANNKQTKCANASVCNKEAIWTIAKLQPGTQLLFHFYFSNKRCKEFTKYICLNFWFEDLFTFYSCREMILTFIYSYFLNSKKKNNTYKLSVQVRQDASRREETTFVNTHSYARTHEHTQIYPHMLYLHSIYKHTFA